MTEALVFHAPPAAMSSPTEPAHDMARGPRPPYRDLGCLALLLQGLRRLGLRTLYAGTRERLLAITTDSRIGPLLPPQFRWELPAISQVVQAARRGIPQVLREVTGDLAVLGVMCLPPKAAETLLRPSARGHFCLVVEGIEAGDPDGELAAQGLKDLAVRTGAAIMVLP